jgi:4-aminobutyrate aminotransferase/(S)-3-amino-2-methylpropionate transaminase
LNRPALGAFPPVGWAELLETGLMKAAPKGMDQCTTTLCGSSANGMPSSILDDHLVLADHVENAFKLAFMAYKQRERGSTDFTSSEMGMSLYHKRTVNTDVES